MGKALPPEVDGLYRAICGTAKSAGYVRRVHEGLTHEASLLIGAWALARQCGVEAGLVELESIVASSGKETFDAAATLFLEVGQHLIGIDVQYTLPRPGLSVMVYPSRKAAEAASGARRRGWKDYDEGQALLDAQKGLDEIAARNDLGNISALLQSVAMQRATGPVAAGGPGPRI